SIVEEQKALNLDEQQRVQAEAQKKAADGAVTARLPEAYQWLLVPEQESPQKPGVTWQAIRLTGTEGLAVRASKKLRSLELLIPSLGPTILRKHLEEVLWRGNHVAVRQLVDDFGRYLYLPRLADSQVLVQSIRDGLALLTWQSDTF